MSYIILVPLLPLLAATVIGVAGSVLRERSVRIVAPAVVSAFAGAVAALVLVTLNGPISVRFYEPSTAGLSVLSLGFYIDRLSAVMMVLRSEEHTSELQSQSNLVCRLLLEKKKRPNN